VIGSWAFGFWVLAEKTIGFKIKPKPKTQKPKAQSYS
jgi:hypothetical protein